MNHKVVLGIASFGVILLASNVLAQQTQQAGRDEPATKFERFLLSKGAVRVREFYDIGAMSGRLGSAKFVVARAYTPGQRDYIFALRIEVTESGRLSRDRIGVLDAEEVTSLATALPQISKMVSVLSQGQDASNTEVDFKGGSVRLGFFVSARGAAGIRDGAFIQAGEIGAATAYFDIGELSRMETLVSQALAKIRDLQQKR